MMSRLTAALLLLMTAGLSSACTATSDPPTPSNPSTFAQAGKFPDMSSYTAANPDDYKREYKTPGRPYATMTAYNFATPDGVSCGFDQPPVASCAGNNFPGIPPAQCNPEDGIYGVNEINTDFGMRKVSDGWCDKPVEYKVLRPFHTLTVYGVTCGVDDSGTTACKDPQGRGFVLSPSWSGWLPKV